MKYATFLALVGSALAAPAPQGVTDTLAPSSGPPDGCSPDGGTFNIQVMNVSSSASKVKVSWLAQNKVGRLKLIFFPNRDSNPASSQSLFQAVP